MESYFLVLRFEDLDNSLVQGLVFRSGIGGYWRAIQFHIMAFVSVELAQSHDYLERLVPLGRPSGTEGILEEDQR